MRRRIAATASLWAMLLAVLPGTPWARAQVDPPPPDPSGVEVPIGGDEGGLDLIPGAEDEGSSTPPVEPPPPPAHEPVVDARVYLPGEEIVDARTRVSKTFATEQPGVVRLKLWNAPVHYQDDSGWDEIESTLVAEGNRFRQAANDLGLSVAAQHTDPRLAAIAPEPGVHIGFALEGARPGSAAPDPHRPDTIVYHGILPATDLEIMSQPNGAKSQLLLRSAQAPTTFRFPLSLSGVEPRLTEDGATVEYVDDEGEVIAATPPGWMLDADGVGPGETSGVAYAMTADERGRPMLEVTLDAVWLHAPERKFPVVVDPSVQHEPYLYEDTVVWDANPNTDYGTAVRLNAGRNYAGRYRSFLQFGGSTGILPQNGDHHISTANLHLRQETGACGSSASIRRVTQKWSHWPSVTWDDQPGYTGTYASHSDCSGGWRSLPIRSLAQQWHDGVYSNYGLAITGSESGTTVKVYFSKEYSSSYDPFIDIWYDNTAPSTPSPQYPANGAMLSSAPTYLQASIHDADGDDTRNDFWLQRWNGSSWVAVSGAHPAYGSPSSCCSSSANLPGLSDSEYRWHARSYDGAHQSGATAWQNFTVDKTQPNPPSVSSSTHPNQNTWYSSTCPSFSWSASDLSGINGYSYVFNTTSTTTPDTSSEGTSRSYSPACVSSSNDYWFHVRARNGAGTWGDTAHFRVQIDHTGPGGPSVSSSTHPSQGTWYANNTASFSWSASDLSGINGYSHTFDGNKTTIPDDTSEGTGTSWSAGARSDGTWYLHVKARNGAGVWGTTTHFQVNIDASAPAAPNISSPTHPDPDACYSNDDPTVTFSASDTSGITRYWYESDTANGTTPDGTPSTTNSSVVLNDRPDGDNWVHARSVNGAGLVSATTTHRRLRIDTTAPTAPTNARSTHQAGQPSADPTVEVAWDASTDSYCGVAGYSYAFNDSQTVPADGSVDTTGTTATSEELTTGRWWFHVRAVDGAGNLSDDTVYGPIVIEQNDNPLPPPPGFEDPVAQSDELGIEPFFPMDGFDVGSGGQGLVHLRTGNTVVQYDLATVPANGLNSQVRLTYNSQRRRDDHGAGKGWLLSVANVDAAGDGFVEGFSPDATLIVGELTEPLADGTYQVLGRFLDLVDGDGTTHRFVRGTDPTSAWRSPPGIDLKVVEHRGTADLAEAYDLIRPDGVTYRVERLSLTGLNLPAWKVVAISDRNGNRLTFTYEPAGGLPRIRSIAHNGRSGVAYRFDYGLAGELTSILSLPSTADERETRLTRDGQGLLVAIDENANRTAAEGRRTIDLAYSAATMQLVAVEDAEDQVTGLVYDGERLDHVVDRAGHRWQLIYAEPDAATGEQSTILLPPGDRQSTVYRISPRGPISDADPRIAGGNVIRIDEADSGSGPITSRFGWQANRSTSTTDGAGATTRTGYDHLGNVISQTTPPPNSPRAALPTDAPTVEVTSTLTYEYSRRLDYRTCTSLPATTRDPVESACYAHADLVRTVAADSADSQQRVADYRHDAAGNLLEVIERARADGSSDAGDRTTTFAYHAGGRGRLATVDGPRDVADTTRYGDPQAADLGYDPSGQPRPITDAAGNAITVAYTAYGQVATSTDRDGRTTSFEYDHLDRRRAEIDNEGDRTTYAFTGNDLLASVETPRGKVTSYDYDVMDRRILERQPHADLPASAALPETTSAYNPDGSLASRTVVVDPAGATRTTTLGYWPSGLVKQTVADATDATAAVTDHTYDTAGRQIEVVHPVADLDGNRPETATTYTPAGQPASVSETASVGSRTVRYAYNAHRSRSRRWVRPPPTSATASRPRPTTGSASCAPRGGWSAPGRG